MIKTEYKTMKIKELLSLKSDTLISKQKKAVLNHVKIIMKKLLNYLEQDDFGAARSMLCKNSSGAYLGLDNEFINFKINGYHINDYANMPNIIILLEDLSQTTNTH